jgi:PAS domain S-box-containing protein
VFTFSPSPQDKEMALAPFTLAFTGRHRHLEKRFQADYFQKNIHHLRICHWLTIFFYGIPGLLDASLFPEIKTSLWAIRYLLVCPVFLVGLAFTYTRAYRRWWQHISMGYMLLTGGGLIWMIHIAPAPDGFDYTSGIVICLMFGYTLIRERFVFASIAGAILLAAYAAVCLTATTMLPERLLHYGMYVFSANLLGMLVAHFLERSARRDFFLGSKLHSEQRNINTLNAQLEDKIHRRTQDLSVANASLQREVAERKQIESALREGQERLKILFDFAPDGYCMLNLKGDIIEGNRSSEIITGYSRRELIGENIFGLELIASTPRSRVRSVRRASLQGIPWGPGEFTLTTKAGTAAEVELRSHPVRLQNRVRILVMIRDVTRQKFQEKDRERLKKQLVQSQKMEAIGTLAGGIAHDFNNILAAISGFTELSLLEAGPGHPLHENLSQINMAGQRARDMIQQILTFSRAQDRKIKPVQAGAVVQESLKLLRASISKAIEIRPRIVSEAFTPANATELQQVVMNLCTNAAHAMGSSGGVLEVSLVDTDLTPSAPQPAPDLPPGRYIELAVNDTGAGMPPEVVQRLFDPYFTTKPKGEGSGLGMAVVHGIVNRYGGGLTVDSTPGRGTSVKVYLSRQPDGGEAIDELSEPPPTGNESILLVDDEPQLVAIEDQMLTHLGYRVTTSGDSFAALEIFRNRPDRFALVITDMSMPQMDGLELTRALQAIRPGVPVILCTGHSAGLTRENALALGVHAVLMKPVSMQALAVTVRKVIDAGQGLFT